MMEKEKEMEAITKQTLLDAPSADLPIPLPGLGCCPCCPCCPCCGCCGCCDCCGCCGSCDGCSCPSCGCESCTNCCPSCCPPSCECCCRACCFLPKLLVPKLPGCPIRIKRVLIILVVIVIVVVVIVGALLMGLHITQAHTETVLQMTIKGLKGEEYVHLPMDTEEATFLVNDGAHQPATIIYDFTKLVIGYKPWDRQACYLTRMDKGNVQGLDAIFKEFQIKSSLPAPTLSGQDPEEEALTPLLDHFRLGPAINILCSHVPIFWV